MNKVYDTIYISGAREIVNEERLENMSYSAVLTLTSAKNDYTTHFVPLRDSDKANYKKFKKAVNTLERLYNKNSDEPIIVHCLVGKSRSVSVTTTFIALNENLSIEEAASLIENEHPKANPNPELLKYGEKFLQESN